MLTKKEKEVLRSILKVHIKGVQKDKKSIDQNMIALFGAEAKYEAALKTLVKKLA